MGSGGTLENTAIAGFDMADTTVTATCLRVKLSGDHGIVAAGVADFDDFGVSHQPSDTAGFGVSGGRCSVILYNKQGTMPFTAAGAISQNAKFYRAASGKVSATAAGKPLGYALEATTADGDIFEGMILRDPDPAKIADPGNGGAIPVTHSGFCPLVTAGAETRTAAIPTFEGQRLTLSMQTDGGDAVVTFASAINQTGNTICTFNDVGDVLDLVAVNKSGALCWRVTTSDGCSLS